MIQQQNQQNIILTKNIDRYGKCRLVVHMDEFDIDKIIIKDNSTKSTNNHQYYVYYSYNDIIGTNTQIIGTLRLYSEDLKLQNDRPYITYRNNTQQKRYVKLPIEYHSNNANDTDNIDIAKIDKLNKIIRSIKTKVLQYIN